MSSFLLINFQMLCFVPKALEKEEIFTAFMLSILILKARVKEREGKKGDINTCFEKIVN